MNKNLLTLTVVFLLSVGIASAVLDVRSAYGQAGIVGFRTVNDSVSFNVSSSDQNITIDSNAAQCTCDQHGLYYCLCALTDSQNLAVASYEISNSHGDTKTASLKVDNSVGRIDFNIVGNKGNATLTYSVTDTGFNGNPACVGINSLEVDADDSNINTIEINSSGASCTVSGTFVLSLVDSGTKNFTLKATDKLGNTNSASRNITVDITPPEISNLVIKSFGTQITTVSSNEIPVDIYFDVTDNTIANITVDISSFHTSPTIKQQYKHIIVPTSSCILNTTSGVFTCVIRNKLLKTLTGNLEANITVQDAYSNTNTQTLTQPLTLDNVKAQAVLNSDYCDSRGNCFLKNGINRIDIKLSKENFANKNVYIDVGGQKTRAYNCTYSSVTDCYALTSVTCNSGDFVEAHINVAPPFVSMDDAGNILIPFTKTFICDNTPPAISNITVGGDYLSSLIVTGANVVLTATVVENEADELNATADLDLLKNGSQSANSCNKDPATGIINCTWIINNINEGYYKADVKLNISDTVGHIVHKDFMISVLGLKKDNVTPQLFQANLDRVAPTTINRITLGLANSNKIPYYAYAFYTITPKQGANNPVLLYHEIKPDGCIYTASDGTVDSARTIFSDIKVSDSYLGYGQENHLEFMFEPTLENVNFFHDRFTIICNITARVQEGNYVYQTPSIMKIEIPFIMRNSQLGTPGQEFVKRIQEREEIVNSDYSNTISTLNNAMTKVQGICNAKGIIDNVQMAGVVMETAGAALNVWLKPAGDPARQTGQTIYDVMNGWQTDKWDPESADPAHNTPTAKIWKFFGQACSFVGCDLAWNKGWQPDRTLAEQIQNATIDTPIIGSQITTDLATSDIKNSIVMSAAKMCLPGIIYNLNKYRQVDCEYLQCLKVYSATGLDINQCDALKSSKTCSIIVGEAFELPFVRIGKNLFSNTADLVRNSYGLGLTEAIKKLTEGSCKDKTSDSAIFLCHLPKAIQEYVSFQKKTIQNIQFKYNPTVDYCTVATCVGPNCYAKNDLLGLDLYKYTPTKDQLENERLNGMSKNLIGVSNTNQYDTSPMQAIYDARYAPSQEVRVKGVNTWNDYIRSYNEKYPLKQLPLLAYDGEKIEKATDVSTYFDDLKKKSPSLTPQELTGKTYENTELGRLEKQRDDANTIYGQYKDMFSVKTFGGNYENLQTDPKAIKDYQDMRATDITTILSSGANPVLKDGDKIIAKPVNNDIKYYLADKDGKEIGEVKSTTDEKTGEVKLDVSGNDPKLAQFKNDFEKRSNGAQQNFGTAQNAYHTRMMEQNAEFIVRLLFDNLGLRRFLTSEYWDERFGFGNNGLTKVAAAVDPTEWKKSLCNPDNGLLFSGSGSPDGTAYQCTGSAGDSCKLVLSFGAEIQQYNDTFNLYTLVYLLGPTNYDITYNIAFKQSSTGKVIRGYNYYLPLAKQNIAQESRAILLPDKYDKICIQFSDNFPPLSYSGRKEYCRDIKENVFNSGSPPTDANILYYNSKKSYTYHPGTGFLG